MEPASANAWATVIRALKDWPLWLFVAVAASLTVFVSVPDFRALVSSSMNTGLVFATVVAWIFVAARAASPIMRTVQALQSAREARINFVPTPVEPQCFWGTARQQDGSIVTQVSGHCLVKNRTADRLYLTTAKLIRPRINGEVLPGLLTMQAVNSNMHGTAHVSGHFIPPGATLPAAFTILIRGAPRQKSGPMRAVLEFADADAHVERVRFRIRCLNSPEKTT